MDKLKLISHPNGFLQVGANKGQFNIFTDAVPKQKVNTRIHNHAHGFTSTILTGEIIHKVYEFTLHENGNFHLYTVIPTDGAQTILSPTGQYGNFDIREIITHRTGTTYTLEPGVFHQVIPVGFTITWFTKEPKIDTPVYVGVPHDQQPDNNYERLEFEYDL